MDYVAYYRVSTKKQGKSGLGLDAQRDAIRQFLGEHDQLTAEFVEIESGRNNQRSELWRAIALAKKTDAALLIARLDRFSRRVSFIATIMDKGIRLVVAEMPNATEFQLHIFAALAQEERRLISIRTKAALKQAKARGVELGKNGKALAKSNKQRADRRASNLVTVLPKNWRQMSLSEIARQLNARGHRTANGKRHHPQTIKNALNRILINDEIKPQPCGGGTRCG